MEISSLARTLRLQEDVNRIKARQDDLGRQLVTGKKTETYGALGPDAAVVLSLRDQISAKKGYVKTMELVNLRLEIQSAAATRFDEISSTLKTESLTTTFKLTGNGQTQLQLNAASQFDEIISLLNTELEGRQLFGGADTSGAPVALPDLILNGDSTHAGLKQFITERSQADLGADNRGRLTLGVVGSTFSVEEDAAPSVFGSKLVGAVSNLQGTTVTGPAGVPPKLDVAFSASLPQQGEKITFEFTLPDGTKENFELTATSIAPAGEGQFLIGADAATTATNFNAAFDTALQEFTKTTVKAASASEAANNFFESNPPQRVNGAPFTAATSLVDGTSTNSVIWYSGDSSNRPAALAKIGDNETVAYGVRADDSSIVSLLKTTALLSVTSFATDTAEDSKHYAELVERVADTVSFKGKRSPLDALMEMGFLQAKIDVAKQQANTSISVQQSIVDERENADSFDVGARLSVIQTQLQAAYQVTARVNSLSLLDFLR